MYRGMFGWLHYRFDRLPLELIMVVVCNLFGAMGYGTWRLFFMTFSLLPYLFSCSPSYALL